VPSTSEKENTSQNKDELDISRRLIADIEEQRKVLEV
jgi:hypothetical protein